MFPLVAFAWYVILAIHMVFHVGGPAFHPTAQQAKVIAAWLGERATCAFYDGASAFDHLDECDLLVIMGLHWTGMGADRSESLAYQPLNEQQKQAFEAYVASGRPLLNHHGGIASYDDWPRFGELLGYTWIWGVTSHSPLGEHMVEVLPTVHPLAHALSSYQIFDEIYYDIKIAEGLKPTTYATANWENRTVPIVMAATGARVLGAGRTIYIANGHDMRAFASPALKQLWLNCIAWLTTSS